MDWARILAIGVPLMVSGLGVWGALRVAAVRRWVPDRRLTLLALFLGLYSLSWLLQAGGIVLYYDAAEAAVERGFWDGHDWVFTSHHAAMVLALAAATFAYRPPRPDASAMTEEGAASRVPALAPFLLVAEPAFRLVESVGFLYLALRAAWNHRRRQDVGSLRVAAGFLLVLAGNAWLAAVHTPLGPHPVVADLLALVGTAVLVTALPKRGG